MSKRLEPQTPPEKASLGSPNISSNCQNMSKCTQCTWRILEDLSCNYLWFIFLRPVLVWGSFEAHTSKTETGKSCDMSCGFCKATMAATSAMTLVCAVATNQLQKLCFRSCRFPIGNTIFRSYTQYPFRQDEFHQPHFGGQNVRQILMPATNWFKTTRKATNQQRNHEKA